MEKTDCLCPRAHDFFRVNNKLLRDITGSVAAACAENQELKDMAERVSSSLCFVFRCLWGEYHLALYGDFPPLANHGKNCNIERECVCVCVCVLLDV